MKNQELINNVLENQKEIKTQLNRIESLLRKKMFGSDELPFEYETVGYMTVTDLARLGASTRFGKDGKEYLWSEKTDVSAVLHNAKEHGLLEETRQSLIYLLGMAKKNAEKFMTSEFKGPTIEKLDRKIEECTNFDTESTDDDMPF